MADAIETAGSSPPIPPPSRRDKAERHERLCDLIRHTVDTEGQEDDGQIWAFKSLPDWADLLGVSTKTISRLIREPPIQMLDTSRRQSPPAQPASDGRKGPFAVRSGKGRWHRVLALRVGAPAPLPGKNRRHLANIMGKMFRERTDHAVSPKAYGCLIWLAELWPEGHQVAVFKCCLDDWGGFMAGVKLRQAVEGGQVRYLKYPSITVLRRWPHVAADSYLLHLQDKGEGSAVTLPFPYHYT